MKTVHRSVLVPYTVSQMYELVSDIESYPSFLPWCRSATVLQRDERQVKASIELVKGKVREAFTTANRLHRNRMIEMQLVEGPFSYLRGVWRFTPITEQGCRVSLDMGFDFSSRILSAAVGPVFSQIANDLVDSFYRRARELYG